MTPPDVPTTSWCAVWLRLSGRWLEDSETSDSQRFGRANRTSLKYVIFSPLFRKPTLFSSLLTLSHSHLLSLFPLFSHLSTLKGCMASTRRSFPPPLAFYRLHHKCVHLQTPRPACRHEMSHRHWSTAVCGFKSDPHKPTSSTAEGAGVEWYHDCSKRSRGLVKTRLSSLSPHSTSDAVPVCGFKWIAGATAVVDETGRIQTFVYSQAKQGSRRRSAAKANACAF